MTKELLQQALDEAKADAIYVFTYAEGISAASKDAIEYMHSWLTVYFEKQALAQQEPNPWSEAVIDQLVTHFIYVKEHDTDPRKAVKDLLGISNSIALDPQVSSDAQALIDRGRREAQKEQTSSVDAYVGAREDAAIWKKRALEAEELNRKFIAEVNGPTYLGEPAQPAQEPVGRFVKATYGDYGVLDWHPSYVAKIGDCLYTHPAPTQPALKDDVGVACLETMVKTMTNLGIATDSSLEGFGARLEHNIYAMCRAVDGIFKARPALSDAECGNLVEKAVTDFAKRRSVPREHLNTDLNMMPALAVFIARAIEAHLKGQK